MSSATGATGPPAGGDVIVDVRHAVKEFPVTARGIRRRRVATVKAVSDVSLAVSRGEVFGVVGESGCGKTTLGRMVAALTRPTSGEIWVDGLEVGSLSGQALRPMRRHVQLIFQDSYSSLNPRMPVGKIVREPLVIQGSLTRKEAAARVEQLLHEVGLGGQLAHRYPHELSGGQRQRVGLARALAVNPRLIVADEPVSALDVSIRAQILNLMIELQRAHALTYLMISHDLSVVRYIADRVAVMYLGKLVEMGATDDVFARPAHPYTGGLVAAAPAADAAARPALGLAVRGELPSSTDPPSGCRYRTRCPRATDRCTVEEPALRPFGASSVAACHNPLRAPDQGG